IWDRTSRPRSVTGKGRFCHLPARFLDLGRTSALARRSNRRLVRFSEMSVEILPLSMVAKILGRVRVHAMSRNGLKSVGLLPSCCPDGGYRHPNGVNINIINQL